MGSEKLTPAQQAAIENRGGPLLVSAAAGSGKTKVLVDRLMGYLLDEREPANIDDFLIITYTKAAASELRGKIAAKLTEKLAQQPENRHLRHQLRRLYLAKISTVHAFCGDILREYAFSLDLGGDVRVADEVEAGELRLAALERVLEAAYGSIEENEALQAFVDTQGFGRDDRAVPQIVERIYDSARCHVRPEAWLQECLAQGETEGLTDAGQTIWGAYILNRLHDFLDGQIGIFRRLLGEVQASQELGSKYCPALESDLDAMESLRDCTTWEDSRAHCIYSLERLGVVRKPRDAELAEQVKAVREGLKKNLPKYQSPLEASSGQLFMDLQQAQLANEGLCRLVEDFSLAYDREKRRRRVLDFGDLEHMTLRLLLGKNLTGPTRAARELGGRFREIMVDEYQDTNQVQDMIFSTLAGDGGSLFMVGDVKQSIYRFRLADPGIFLDKYARFVPADMARDGQGRKILLSENFRSGEAVLAAANHVFKTSMCPQVGGLYYGEAESLRAGIPHKPLPQPAVELHCIELMDTSKYDTEARFVAKRIRELLDGGAQIPQGDGFRPVMPEDIVILLRSPGTGGRYYREALEALGIPVASDTPGSILESGEISILRSFLEVLDNPMQDIPLQSILLSPVFDFTADRLGSLRARHRKGCLFDGLEAAAAEGQEDAGRFLALLDSLRQTARAETLTRLLERVLEETHWEAVFSVLPGGYQRSRNLRFFFESAASFEQGGRRDLGEFLEHLRRMEQKGLRPEEGSGKSGAVTILSIHKSKGLEFPVVFLCNLSGKFNREDLKANVLVDPVLGIGASAVNQNNRSRYPTLAKAAAARRLADENTSEELRVLYVAMTRARDMLIMTHADKYLRNHLTSLRCRLMPGNTYALAREAGCLGDWVLQAALLRSEAAELFAQVGRPEDTVADGYPWAIFFHSLTQELPGEKEAAPTLSEAQGRLPQRELLEALLLTPYAHIPATAAPAKLTATQLKGRELDKEAADGAFSPLPAPTPHFRKPDFLMDSPLSGREIGTATHLAMQFLCYRDCATREGIDAELTRLLEQAFITQRQYRAVNRNWIARFFEGPLGRKLMESDCILREFKFSILEDGSTLDADLAGEQLLLQGVVDCCLMEDDGLTVLDFKTDKVSPGQEGEKAARYAGQVRAYGRALERIWERPVKKLLLYFFQTDALMEIPL